MAYVLPNFNLSCNIHTVAGGVNSFRLSSPCNLALGRRVGLDRDVAGQDGALQGQTPTLLLPPLTDIRDASCGGESDIVEVPAGSGRWYLVLYVDDIGKGFANEHRIATINKTWNFPGSGSGLTAPWPTPIP